MLPELQAEAQLAAIEAASVPHMTEKAQRDVIRGNQRFLESGKPAPATPDQLAAAGIRVTRVPKEVT